MTAWTRAMPWRQGSVIALTDLQALQVSLPESCAGGLIITHDCDLANDDEREPLVECLPFKRLDAANGNNTNAKSPRVLHLELQLGVDRCWIEVCAPDKLILSKTRLAELEPAESWLSDKDRQVLQGWLATRYRRHAFPDELVERMRPLTAHLERQLKGRAQAVLGVWIDYQPRATVAENEPYEIWLYLVYSTDSPDNQVQTEDAASNVARRFSDSSDGLVLAECTAVSEAGFTLADQRSTVEFRFEHLSHRIFPDGAVIE